MMEKELIELEGKIIISYDIFCDEMYRIFGFPRNYGHNPNALYDTFGGNCLKNVKIIWKGHQISRDAMGAEYFDSIVSLLREIQTEEPTFELELR